MERNQFTPEQTDWIEGLESDRFSQTRNYLKRKHKGEDDFSYCCLGVATELFDPASPALKMIPTGPATILSWQGVFSEGDEAGEQYAPTGVWENLNLKSEYGALKYPFEYPTLVEMNDSGKSFKEIAKFIRDNPWAVFTNFDKPEGV